MKESRPSVLLVDDEVESIRFLGQLLGREGWQVHVAESGERALAVAEALAGEVRLGLVLLDILMPGGMNGLAACRRLKARRELANTPVIFLTGRDDRETMVRAFEAGGADYVHKPINADVLLARARTHYQLGLLSSGLEAALAERTRELRDANACLRRLAMETTLIAERERRSLAGELHDGPMQKLALAQMQLGAALRRRDDEGEERLRVGQELLQESLAELRSLQFALSPPLLYQEGLGPALRLLASHVGQRFGLQATYQQSGAAEGLDPDLAVLLYQCARELVYNVVRHAGATAVYIELSTEGSEALLVVSDNGRGFQPGTGPAPGEGGYGLQSIRERLALVGGRLAVDTGGGTRAALHAPL